MSSWPVIFKQFYNDFPHCNYQPEEIMALLSKVANLCHSMQEGTVHNQETPTAVSSSSDEYVIHFDVSNFNPEEIAVRVDDENRTIIVEAKHNEKLDQYGIVARHVTRKYIVPPRYNLDSVKCEISTDGLLKIVTGRKSELRNVHIKTPVISSESRSVADSPKSEAEVAQSRSAEKRERDEVKKEKAEVPKQKTTTVVHILTPIAAENTKSPVNPEIKTTAVETSLKSVTTENVKAQEVTSENEERSFDATAEGSKSDVSKGKKVPKKIKTVGKSGTAIEEEIIKEIAEAIKPVVVSETPKMEETPEKTEETPDKTETSKTVTKSKTPKAHKGVKTDGKGESLADAEVIKKPVKIAK